MSANSLQEISDPREAPSAVAVKTRIFARDPQAWYHRAWPLRRNPMIWDNLSLVAIGLAYILGIYAVHALFDIHDKVILIFYSGWFARMAIVFSGFYILFHIWKKSYRRLFTSRNLVGFLMIVAFMPVFKSAFASYKQTIPLVHEFTLDFSLMRLDYILHFGHHPWRLLEPILFSPMTVRAVDFVYTTWFYVLFLSCLWMAWTPRRHLRLCYLISTLLVWILIGSVLATILSSAGPCFYSRVVSASDNPFAPLMRRLSEISVSGKGDYLDAIFNQAGLWEGKITATWGAFAGISAMPSIHLAMATLFAFLAFEVRKWLGWIFVGYAAIILIGSIILGWHYAVDGYAGIILASLIWHGVKRLVYRTAPQPG
jgi:hypothetical protein